MRATTGFALLLTVFLAGSSAKAARNFQLRGQNALNGGIGFSAGLTDWSPGGFKWFNDYDRELSRLVWLNIQLNVSTGGDYYDCWYDAAGHRHCGWVGGYSHFGGTALEAAVGVKFKWRLRHIPLQFHAKIGGAIDGLFLWSDIKGAAFGPRGGFGVRYFFVPTFGLGAELVWSIGPAFLNHDVGAELWSTLDFNIGVEWRF
jgi:hypothetical protein